jgi:hypothetical protein
LDDRSNQRTVSLRVTIDGVQVSLVPWIGIDRLRAVQGPAHTHDGSGTIWLEGRGADQVTLGEFFILWGVRFNDECLGAACQQLTVIADATAVPDPVNLRLASASMIEVSARSA